MKLLAKILVGVDITQDSDDYIESVISFAKRFKSLVIPIYILKPRSENINIQQFLFEASVHKMNLIKNHIIDQGVKCTEPIVLEGNPSLEIIREAEVQDVNLIILKRHIKDDRLLSNNLGIITEKIIHKTEIPVFVINDQVKAKFKHILCPVDYSASSVRALQNAITLSRKFNAKLTVMNVYESLQPVFHVSHEDILEEIERERLQNLKKFESFINENKFKGIKLDTFVSSGYPEIEILNAVKELKTDILIMGSSGKSGLSRFFMGSTTEKVLREVACSFITMKSKNFIKVVLEAKMNDLDTHFKEAQQLHRNGLFERAIREYKLCMEIDNMHIRSYQGIAKVYDEIGNQEKAEHYRELAKDIYDHMWDEKIEREVRKHYKSSLEDHQIHQ